MYVYELIDWLIFFSNSFVVESSAVESSAVHRAAKQWGKDETCFPDML